MELLRCKERTPNDMKPDGLQTASERLTENRKFPAIQPHKHSLHQQSRKRKLLQPLDCPVGPLQERTLTVGESQPVWTGYRQAEPDTTLLNDSRVLSNLLAIEERYLPSPSYFQCVQKDIEPWMRERVSTWMLEVCEEQQCEEGVFPLAMNILDRMLSVLSCPRTQLQLLASGCMFLASKLRETEPLQSRKLVIYTDHSIKLAHLIQCETLILQHLKWDINAITPHDFLPHILVRLPLTTKDAGVVQRHAQTFIALCLATGFRFALYPPSMLAAASVCTALQGLHGRRWCLDMRVRERLQNITGIEYEYLQTCQDQIEKTLQQSLPSSNDGSSSGDASSSHNPPATPDKATIPKTTPNTPTDVRDIDFS